MSECATLRRQYRKIKGGAAFAKLEKIAIDTGKKLAIARAPSDCKKRLIKKLVENYINSEVFQIQNLNELIVQIEWLGGNKDLYGKAANPIEIFMSAGSVYGVEVYKTLGEITNLVNRRIKQLQQRGTHNNGASRVQPPDISEPPTTGDDLIHNIAPEVNQLYREIKAAAYKILDTLEIRFDIVEGIVKNTIELALVKKDIELLNKKFASMSNGSSWQTVLFELFIGVLTGPILGAIVKKGIGKLSKLIPKPSENLSGSGRIILLTPVVDPSGKPLIERIYSLKEKVQRYATKAIEDPFVSGKIKGVAAEKIKSTMLRIENGPSPKVFSKTTESFEDSMTNNLRAFARTVYIGYVSHLRALLDNSIEDPSGLSPRDVLLIISDVEKPDTWRKINNFIKEQIGQYKNHVLFCGMVIGKFAWENRMGSDKIWRTVRSLTDPGLTQVIRKFGVGKKWGHSIREAPSGAGMRHLTTARVSFNVMYLDLKSLGKRIPFTAIVTEDKKNFYDIYIDSFFQKPSNSQFAQNNIIFDLAKAKTEAFNKNKDGNERVYPIDLDGLKKKINPQCRLGQVIKSHGERALNSV